MMFFDKLDGLMSEIVDFADFIIYSTVLGLFLPKKPRSPTETRTHDPWIRFQHNNIQRPSGHCYWALVYAVYALVKY
jgi:hypothetical protein